MEKKKIIRFSTSKEKINIYNEESFDYEIHNVRTKGVIYITKIFNEMKQDGTTKIKIIKLINGTDIVCEIAHI